MWLYWEKLCIGLIILTFMHGELEAASNRDHIKPERRCGYDVSVIFPFFVELRKVIG